MIGLSLKREMIGAGVYLDVQVFTGFMFFASFLSSKSNLFSCLSICSNILVFANRPLFLQCGSFEAGSSVRWSLSAWTKRSKKQPFTMPLPSTRAKKRSVQLLLGDNKTLLPRT